MGVTKTRYTVKFTAYLDAPRTEPLETEVLYYNPFVDAPADNAYLDEVIAKRMGIHPDRIRDVTIEDDY